MSEIDFDTEKFILSIKERPCLWDMTTEEYSNKNIKKKMWEEITLLFRDSDKIDNARENNKLCK